MEIGQKDGEAFVRDVGQAPDRPACVNQQHSSPSLVRSDLSPGGYRSGRLVATMGRAVSVCFSILL